MSVAAVIWMTTPPVTPSGAESVVAPTRAAMTAAVIGREPGSKYTTSGSPLRARKRMDSPVPRDAPGGRGSIG
jgi:hypothetical protein